MSQELNLGDRLYTISPFTGSPVAMYLVGVQDFRVRQKNKRNVLGQVSYREVSFRYLLLGPHPCYNTPVGPGRILTRTEHEVALSAEELLNKFQPSSAVMPAPLQP